MMTVNFYNLQWISGYQVDNNILQFLNWCVFEWEIFKCSRNINVYLNPHYCVFCCIVQYNNAGGLQHNFVSNNNWYYMGSGTILYPIGITNTEIVKPKFFRIVQPLVRVAPVAAPAPPDWHARLIQSMVFSTACCPMWQREDTVM